MPVIFWVGGEGAFGLEHAVLFFTRYLDPKPLRNQSEFVLNNKAEGIDFYIFPLSLFGAVKFVKRIKLEPLRVKNHKM